MMSEIQSLSPGVAYIVILVLTVIVYGIAFDIRLPLLKKILVYCMLTLGCILLTLFHILRFPIIAVLAITVVLIFITKVRLMMTNRRKYRKS